MYSLRMINKHGQQFNFALGNSYSYIKKSEVPHENAAFEEQMKLRGVEAYTGKVEDGLRYDLMGIIFSDITGSIDLFSGYGYEYYIVMDNGQTYANLTKR